MRLDGMLVLRMDTPTFELYRLDRELDHPALLSALGAMPSRFAAAFASAKPPDIERKGGGEWSPLEVLRHVRDVVQVYGMRFKWMILDDDPFLPNYDEDNWVAASPDGPEQLADMLAELSAYRAETIRLLRALPPDGWLRTGRHEVLGNVVLDPYVRHQLAHEEQHLEQLQRALSR